MNKCLNCLDDQVKDEDFCFDQDFCYTCKYKLTQEEYQNTHWSDSYYGNNL